jgi:hypothetical protein
MPLQSWAIYRREHIGELTYLGVVAALSEADALFKADIFGGPFFLRGRSACGEIDGRPASGDDHGK